LRGIKIPVCDMCGASNRLVKAEVEGTMLNVCKHCVKFGKVKGNENKFRKRRLPPRPLANQDANMILVVDYSTMIKKKREQLDLKQEDFAKKINEKASILQKVESGHFKPSLKLAKKIQKFLKIQIIEKIENGKLDLGTSQSDSFTLGDFIKVRK